MPTDDRKIPEKKKEKQPDEVKPIDEVTETSEDSFPASDPPSWTSLHSGPPDNA